jgi:hypothetical protein
MVQATAATCGSSSLDLRDRALLLLSFAAARTHGRGGLPVET